MGDHTGSDVSQGDEGRKGRSMRMRVMLKFWVAGKLSHSPGTMPSWVEDRSCQAGQACPPGLCSVTLMTLGGCCEPDYVNVHVKWQITCKFSLTLEMCPRVLLRYSEEQCVREGKLKLRDCQAPLGCRVQGHLEG